MRCYQRRRNCGSIFQIDNIRVFTRRDCCVERLRRALVILSGKGTQVIKIPDVRPVYGFPINGRTARSVRVQRLDGGYIHMSEVEVAGRLMNGAGNPVVKKPKAERAQGETVAAINVFKRAKTDRDEVMKSPQYGQARKANAQNQRLIASRKNLEAIKTSRPSRPRSPPHNATTNR